MSHAHRTGRRRGRAGRSLTALVAAALLGSTSAAHATVTAEQVCQSERAKVAARYTLCADRALVQYTLTFNSVVYTNLAGKCVTKYARAWARLQANASGTGATCDSSRFVDNGDGTVTDRLTALQWEQKTNLDSTQNFADPHDADNTYTWSAGGAGGTAADGTAFTSFLASLNTGGCFAGHCDWRLPTRDELQTLLTPAYPACTTGPCIDPALGPTVAFLYWSATTDAIIPNLPLAWFVSFSNGFVNSSNKSVHNIFGRAVRSGL